MLVFCISFALIHGIHYSYHSSSGFNHLFLSTFSGISITSDPDGIPWGLFYPMIHRAYILGCGFFIIRPCSP